MSKKIPFFSVIIPTYNQCDFLKKAIESVLNQSLKNFEIIVIDNFSNDGTEKLLKSLKKKIIFRKIRNLGVIAKSRNKGIKLAKGKWISFLDSDDIWTKDKLKENYKVIKNKKINVICNNEIIVDEKNKKKVWRYGPFEKNFYLKLLIFGNRNSTSASSVEKNFLKKNKIFFDEQKKFTTAEDYSFFLKFAYKQAKFYYLNQCLGIHSIHKKSASSNEKKHQNAIREVLNYHVFKYQKNFKDKKSLWNKIIFNLKIKSQILEVVYKKNFISIIDLIFLFISNPISFCLQIQFLIKKKYQNIVSYLKLKKLK